MDCFVHLCFRVFLLTLKYSSFCPNVAPNLSTVFHWDDKNLFQSRCLNLPLPRDHSFLFLNILCPRNKSQDLQLRRDLLTLIHSYSNYQVYHLSLLKFCQVRWVSYRQTTQKIMEYISLFIFLQIILFYVFFVRRS